MRRSSMSVMASLLMRTANICAERSMASARSTAGSVAPRICGRASGSACPTSASPVDDCTEMMLRTRAGWAMAIVWAIMPRGAPDVGFGDVEVVEQADHIGGHVVEPIGRAIGEMGAEPGIAV